MYAIFHWGWLIDMTREEFLLISQALKNTYEILSQSEMNEKAIHQLYEAEGLLKMAVLHESSAPFSLQAKRLS